MDGEVFFNMTENEHPIYGSSSFLMKRWKKYTIYSKSGSYNRTTSSHTNLYQSNSIYLYDYVIVSDQFFYNYVYTASTIDSTPNLDGNPGPDYNYVPTNTWHHRANTFKNSPDAIVNNYIYQLNSDMSTFLGRNYYGPNIIIKNNNEYFEIIKGYPRNHFTHKQQLFSLYRTKNYDSGSYIKNRQTIDSTVDESTGLENGSPPIQSIEVGNLNLIKRDNIINN